MQKAENRVIVPSIQVSLVFILSFAALEPKCLRRLYVNVVDGHNIDAANYKLKLKMQFCNTLQTVLSKRLNQQELVP